MKTPRIKKINNQLFNYSLFQNKQQSKNNNNLTVLNLSKTNFCSKQKNKNEIISTQQLPLFSQSISQSFPINFNSQNMSNLFPLQNLRSLTRNRRRPILQISSSRSYNNNNNHSLFLKNKDDYKNQTQSQNFKKFRQSLSVQQHASQKLNNFSSKLQQLKFIKTSVKKQMLNKCSNFTKGYAEKLKKQRKRQNKKKNNILPVNLNQNKQKIKVVMFDRIIYKPYQNKNSSQSSFSNQINFSRARTRRLNNNRYIQQLSLPQQTAFQCLSQKKIFKQQIQKSLNKNQMNYYKRNIWTSLKQKTKKEKQLQPWEVKDNCQSLIEHYQF